MKICLLKKKNFSLLMVGKFVSLLGNEIQRVALSLYVLKITGSATKFASVLALTVIPQCILGPIAGVLADWIDRKKLIVYLDILSGIIVGVYAYLYIISGKFSLIYIYSLTILLSIISVIFNPAISTILPSIIDKEDLVDANSIDCFIRNMANFLAPIISGVLFSVFGMFVILMGNSISFILSAISEMFINISKVNIEFNTITINKFYTDFSEGVKFIRSKKILVSIIILGLIVNFVYCPIFSLGINYISKQILKITDYQFGMLNAILVVPMLIAPFIASTVGKKYSLGKILFLDMLITSFFIAILAIVPSAFYLKLFSSNFIPYISLIIIGCLIILITSIGNIMLGTIIQHEVPLYLMGRVNAVMTTFLMASTPLGQMAFGILFDKISACICIILASLIVFTTVMLLKKDLLGNNNKSNYEKNDCNFIIKK